MVNAPFPVPRLLNPTATDRILVTGGAGFLGRVLVEQLLERTASTVVVLALPLEPVPESWQQRWADRVTVHRGDITAAEDVARAMGGCQWCFHLAALVGDAGRDEDHQRVTVGGTLRVFESALLHQTAVVLVTSICAYGDAIQHKPCSEDVMPGVGQGPYGRAKQGQEALARRYMAKGVQVCVVRPANIIGPGSGPWVIDAAEVLRQGLPALIGGGRGNAALAGVDNVADFLLHAAMHPQAWGQAFHVHDGLSVTWREYFTELASLLGTRPPRSVPRALAYLGAWLTEPLFKRVWPRQRPPVTAEALNLIAWDSRFPLDRARALGWQPKVDHATQMARIAAWLKARAAQVTPTRTAPDGRTRLP
jgi:2-alkyl-3-oxoalkanoate reductase